MDPLCKSLMSSLLFLLCFFFLFVYSPPFFPFPPLLFFIMYLWCLLLRPVRYQRRQCSASLPLKNPPQPNLALCHIGTFSKPVSLERLISLCPSGTCSSACFPGLMLELDPQRGASLLPFEQTSWGRVCLFLGKQTLGVAWAAGGWFAGCDSPFGAGHRAPAGRGYKAWRCCCCFLTAC